MELSQVAELISDFYELDASDIEKIKNVYKVKVSDNFYCLKTINYEYGHFLFILSAIKHLQSRGFDRIPEIIQNKYVEEYVRFEQGYAYLTPWINARESNYDNPFDLKNAAIKLSELHKYSRGFEITSDMKPRIGWFKWIDKFSERTEDIIRFKDIINEKTVKSEFDKLFVSEADEEIERARTAIENLCHSSYFDKMSKEIYNHGFCHHDYAYHNVLMGSDKKIDIIDFDYCILDSGLHDLGSLLLRAMKNCRWSMDRAIYILDAYSSVNEIENTDIPIMSAFMEFPQDFWQVGLQYYIEKQPWEEKYFEKKLLRYLDDRYEKEDFIEEFREFKYL